MGSLVRAGTSLLRSRTEFTRLLESFRDLCKDRLLLFSLSRDTPDLEQSLWHLSSCAANSLGCLSAPLPVKSKYPFFSCSIAIFEQSSCVPFSSLETGDGPIQVGRWHAYDKRKTNSRFDDGVEQHLRGKVNWGDVWNSRGSTRCIPQELKNVCDARTLLYFCDSSSWNLATALNSHLPQASQLGITASSTPFVTGQPFTLLRNGKVQPSGVVGLALKSDPSENVLTFDGITRLTQPLVVRRAEGNLIHELDNSLPAVFLLKSIKDHGLPEEQLKDIDYYIGIRDEQEHVTDGPPSRLLKIIAGSPSRGSIAVEEVPAPPSGTRIEFFYRQRASPVRAPTGAIEHSKRKPGAVIGALVDTLENHSSSLTNIAEDFGSDPLRTYDSAFLVSSEHGFIHGTGSTGGIWKCIVPGAFGGLRLS